MNKDLPIPLKINDLQVASCRLYCNKKNAWEYSVTSWNAQEFSIENEKLHFETTGKFVLHDSLEG